MSESDSMSPLSPEEERRMVDSEVARLTGALAAAERRAQEAGALVTQLRCALDGADCTYREGGDTRHCGLKRPCWHCQADNARTEALEEAARVASFGGHRSEIAAEIRQPLPFPVVASSSLVGESEIARPVSLDPEAPEISRGGKIRTQSTHPKNMSIKPENGDTTTAGGAVEKAPLFIPHTKSCAQVWDGHECSCGAGYKQTYARPSAPTGETE